MIAVGIVIPAYRPDVARLTSYIDELRDHIDSSTIRVELDRPSTATREALAALDVDLNTVAERRGKGAAITDGFDALETDVFAYADADGSTAVRSIRDVIDAVRIGDAAVCAGSRRHPNAAVPNHQTIARRYLGGGFAWLARRFLDVSLYDYQCGVKALTRRAWEAVRPHLLERGFAWDVELLAIAAAMGFDIAEQPVTWADADGSTVDPVTTSVELLRALPSIRHRSMALQGHPVHSAIPTPGER